ncbi:hypothetical protein OOT33_00585 [Sphingobium sp. DEHP117]|uniref:DUF5681 domain-containing protein n=1 Tax=Sphingobium sp. DEHP117 TaxID=2993436 RepID=UPI0027D5576D|nr:DUF5681 domain-containing protein [Sphingobium sp. DEHP117]MDQ4418943.1 hypothetical protein [Sphingobium sp. DEHP117]
MADRKTEDYEVGYKKPPKHSQFLPGQSGNKRRRKPEETPAEIVARVRDERMLVNGKRMTRLELAVTSALNQTIRSGKPRDVEALFKILDRYGALPQADEGQRAKEDAEKVYNKIMDIFCKTNDISPEDEAEVERLEKEEAKLVMSCSHCGPELRRQWGTNERKGLAERYGTTRIHNQVKDVTTEPKYRRIWDMK